jgi:hypothetical protein
VTEEYWCPLITEDDEDDDEVLMLLLLLLLLTMTFLVTCTPELLLLLKELFTWLPAMTELLDEDELEEELLND